MSAVISGFICALVLAALILSFIAYCMFYRERQKDENKQYEISDLQHHNYQIAQEKEMEAGKKEVLKDAAITAGIFILPRRHKHKDDDYMNRPDYPEGGVQDQTLRLSTNHLMEHFTESAVDADVHSPDRDLCFDLEATSCRSAYQSDV